MRVITAVPAESVRRALAAGRDVARGSGPWTLKFLDRADRQFGGLWQHVALEVEDARAIVLPPHGGEPCRGDRRELVPEGGATVRETAARLRKVAADYARENPECWSRIVQAQAEPLSTVILTTAPLDLDEYASLAPRPDALYHLDGFHRLLGWALDGRLEGDDVSIDAFVAGPPHDARTPRQATSQ